MEYIRCDVSASSRSASSRLLPERSTGTSPREIVRVSPIASLISDWISAALPDASGSFSESILRSASLMNAAPVSIWPRLSWSACPSWSRSCRPESTMLFSSAFWPVMSRAIAEAPMIAPFLLTMGEMVSDTSRRRPSLRLRTVSWCSMRSPRAMRLRMSLNSSRISGGTIIVTTCRPSTSSAQ